MAWVMSFHDNSFAKIDTAPWVMNEYEKILANIWLIIVPSRIKIHEKIKHVPYIKVYKSMVPIIIYLYVKVLNLFK